MTNAQKEIKIEQLEEVKAEVHYYVLNVGLYQFKVPTKSLEGISKKLLQLRKKRMTQEQILEQSRKAIVSKLRFRKELADELHYYFNVQPTLEEIVSPMIVKLYAAVKFKLDDGQQKLDTDKMVDEAIAAKPAKRLHHKKKE